MYEDGDKLIKRKLIRWRLVKSNHLQRVQNNDCDDDDDDGNDEFL